MKKILFSFLMFASAAVFAQQTNSFVVVDGNVASEKFAQENQKYIKSKQVYKASSALPAGLKKFENYASNGITELKMKEERFDRIEFSALNEQFNLPESNPVYFDGIQITDTNLKVIGDVLAAMEVKMIDGKQVLEIRSSK